MGDLKHASNTTLVNFLVFVRAGDLLSVVGQSALSSPLVFLLFLLLFHVFSFLICGSFLGFFVFFLSVLFLLASLFLVVVTSTTNGTLRSSPPGPLLPFPSSPFLSLTITK